jgi:hypothetical protein
MRNNQLLMTALAGAGLYLLYRYWQSETAATLSPTVQHKLPTQNETIADPQGNYDIDGVSFDDEGVIVSGDDNKHLVNPANIH